jgi:hypothetical protein
MEFPKYVPPMCNFSDTDIRTKLTYPEDYPDYEAIYAEAMKEIDRLDVEIMQLKYDLTNTKELAND